MTKLRYWFFCYLAVMLLLLLFIGYGFERTDAEGRDMVFYHEQRILVQQALQRGENRERVEREYGCRILLFSDEDYEIALGGAYQNEALIMDLIWEREPETARQDGGAAGKIVWNVSEQRYRSMERVLYRRMLIMWGIVLAAVCCCSAFFMYALSVRLHNCRHLRGRSQREISIFRCRCGSVSISAHLRKAST